MGMQVVSDILRNPDDRTKISLIYACRDEDEILMRECLDEWAHDFPTKFKIHYILSDTWPKNWKHSKGFVSKALFEKILYPADVKTYNLMCGPPIMLEEYCTPYLKALGHDSSRNYSF